MYFLNKLKEKVLLLGVLLRVLEERAAVQLCFREIEQLGFPSADQ